MTYLVDSEETYGEYGYYMATLEAAVQHVSDLSANFQKQNSNSNYTSNRLVSGSDQNEYSSSFNANGYEV